VGTHLIPAAHDHGIPEVRAAGLLAIMGIFDLAGTTASGWLSTAGTADVLAVVLRLRGLSLLFLPFALATPGRASGCSPYSTDSTGSRPCHRP
jgi:hypothetical protein